MSRPAPGCAPCAPAWRPPPVSTSSLPHRSPPPPLLRSMSDTPVTWGHGQMFAVNQCDPARFITVHFRQLTRLVKLMRAAIKNINYLVHKLCSAKTKFLVIPSVLSSVFFSFFIISKITKEKLFNSYVIRRYLDKKLDLLMRISFCLGGASRWHVHVLAWVTIWSRK